jgi:hypothetical protein
MKALTSRIEMSGGAAVEAERGGDVLWLGYVSTIAGVVRGR